MLTFPESAQANGLAAVVTFNPATNMLQLGTITDAMIGAFDVQLELRYETCPSVADSKTFKLEVKDDTMPVIFAKN